MLTNEQIENNVAALEIFRAAEASELLWHIEIPTKRDLVLDIYHGWAAVASIARREDLRSELEALVRRALS